MYATGGHSITHLCGCPAQGGFKAGCAVLGRRGKWSVVATEDDFWELVSAADFEHLSQRYSSETDTRCHSAQQFVPILNRLQSRFQSVDSVYCLPTLSPSNC